MNSSYDSGHGEQAWADEAGKPRRNWLPVLLSVMVLAVSLLATVVLTMSAQQQAERVLQADFDFQVREVARRIEQRMATYEQVARGTQAFLLGSLDIRRDDYRLFVESLRLQEKFPGIQGLAIAQVVPKQQLAQHVQAMRSEGFPEYRVTPEGEREEYSAITHIEPFSGLNLRALGFDMLTSPVRRAAMERARDSGQASASGKIKLIQENGVQEQAGLVMYVPVYRRGAPVQTVEQRRANLIAWIGAPFRMNDLMANLSGERGNDLLLSVYDGINVSEEALMYRSAGTADPAASATSSLHARQRIPVSGHAWTLDIHSSPSYERRLASGAPHMIAIGGAAGSILLSMLVWTLASGRGRALALARGMTQQLRESEFRLKFALEGAGDGVWDWDTESNKVLYSKRWKEMLGYREEEIGSDITEWERLLHPDDRQQALQQAADFVAGKTMSYSDEYRMQCRDGSWKWLLSRGVGVRRNSQGKVLRAIGVHTDITVAKEHERALQAANAQLAAEQQRIKVILEHSHDAFIAIDEAGLVTDWNAQAERIFGWSAGEAIGKDLGQFILPAGPPGTKPKGFRELATDAHGKLVSRVMELETVDGTGRHIPVEVALARFPAETGYAVSAFIRDISELKQAQQQEAERARALEEARDALRHTQKLEAVGKLTGGVAHDFNNVLQIMSGNIQLLQHLYPSDEALQKRLQSMLSAVQRGAKLSSQLLAFARRQPLQPVTLNLRTTLANMDDLLKRAAGETIELETLADENLWNILVDRGNLENVILNLLINARDAMPAGGQVLIEMRNVVLDGGPAEAEVLPGEYVCMSVADSGCGMSQEVIEQAFEPFFTTKPAGEGTGLGLSMAYGFVKQSGGHIRLDSEVGKGTTVRIYLPRSTGMPEQAPAERRESVVGGSESILVVEDDLEVQHSVVAMLQGLGYAVCTADNGDIALGMIENGTPVDLLFTDVVMPGTVSSPDLARKAKSLLPNLGVLFTSGYTRNALLSNGKLESGVQLLSKPYRHEELAKKVRDVLDDRKRTAAPQGR